MDIAGGVLAGVAALLLLHQTALPLARGRAALWYGRQALATTVALIGAVATQLWIVGVLILAVIAAAQIWGPWVAWGVGADAVAATAKRSASMVRARYEPVAARQDSKHPSRRAKIGGAATVSVMALGPKAALVVLRGARTPKVRLWRNLFRKQILNHRLRVR